MLWFFRTFIKATIFILIIAAILIVVAVFVLDPNDFKTHINHMMQEYSGLDLQFEGPIEWTIRPNTHINIQNISLNADDKSPVLQIKEADIHFNLHSLLSDTLQVSALQFTDVNLDWTKVKNISRKSRKKARNCMIQELMSQNTRIIVQDAEKNLDWELKSATISATNIVVGGDNNQIPISVTGTLLNVTRNTEYKVNTVIKLDKIKRSADLDPLTLTWKNTPIHGNALIEEYNNGFNVSGKLILDATDVNTVLKNLEPDISLDGATTHNLQSEFSYAYSTVDHTLDLSAFSLALDSGTITGNLKCAIKSPYKAEFSVNATDMNLEPLTLLYNALFPNFRVDNLKALDLLKDLSVDGKFSGNKLLVNQFMQIDQIDVAIKGTQGTIQVAPAVISAYGGTHNMTLNLDLVSKDQPYFQLTEQADKVDLEPWLNAIGYTNVISGNASIKADITAEGVDVEALISTLSGKINLYINNGTLYGVDATKAMEFATSTVGDIFEQLTKSSGMDLNKLASAHASDWTTLQGDDAKTTFDHCELKADIDQDSSTKASITLDNNSISINGSGGFKLVDGTLNFNTTILANGEVTNQIKSLAKFMKQAPLPMTISGTFHKPLFTPNIANYTTNIIKLAQTDILNQAVSKMVAATPANSKTPKTATDLFLDSLKSLSL